MTTQWHAKRGYDGTTAERTGLGLGADGRAILFYDTDLTSWWLWNGAGWDAMGPGGDPHPQYVIISPLASARNVITAATATIRPLAIRTTDDDTTNPLTVWLESGGGTTAQFDAAGRLLVDNDVANVDGVGITIRANRARTDLANRHDVFEVRDSANSLITYVESIGLQVWNLWVGGAIEYTTPGGDAGIRIYAEDDNFGKTVANAIDITNTGPAATPTLAIYHSSTADTRILLGNFGRTTHLVEMRNDVAVKIAQVIRLAAAQSADALQIQNSTPATLWLIEHDGGQVIQQAVVTTGAPTPSLIVISAAHTTLTASVERHEVDFNFSATQQWATGPTATQRAFRVRPQTIAAVGASVFSNVSTIYVDGPPIAGANVTLTNTSALIIASGSTVLGETTKQTNTGSLQLSGYWTFAEDAGDPTADANYGKMWTKSDNNLYFQDGDGVTHIIHGAPTFLSETVTTQGLGANPDIFAFGFYEWSAADGNLTQAVNVTIGDANVSHASHAFIVAGGAGATDAGTVGLRVTGTSITDAGVRTVADSETLSADITTLNLDDYLETTLKWLGTVTFELFIVGGLPTVYSLDINYGLAKYEDSMNIDFTISSVQATGLAGAADADFDIQLYHHDPSGTWVYSAAAFTPLNAAQLIASLVTDHSTDDRLANQDHFAWKHTGLSQVVSGSTDEGFIILISSSANNAVEYCNLRVGVES